MAKVMTFSDQFGNTYQSSYWRVAQINLSVADRTAQVVVYGYKDAASRQSGKAPIGQKTYTIGGSEFDQLFSSPAAQQFASLAYTGVINVTADVPDPNNPGKMTNFFAGAVDAL